MRDRAWFATALLGWYDRNARVLPWRIGPEDRASGILPDPYRVWLSEVMLQQTTVRAADGYFRAFIQRWPSVHDLADAADGEVMAAWAGLGYYARARNLLACARIVSRDLGGKFPETEAELRRLPGVGPYTSAAIAAIAFDRPATVVDGNVKRVVARVCGIGTPLPAAAAEICARAAELAPTSRPGDFAQAVMDLGATLCTPRNPRCSACPLREACIARKAGIAGDLPRRAAVPVRPTRRGVAYVAIRCDGALLLERRPRRGLLGGMLGWPGSAWEEAIPNHAPPCKADWLPIRGTVRHVFTHFELRLEVMTARVPVDCVPATGFFVAADAFDAGGLPTAMRKVWKHAEPALPG